MDDDKSEDDLMVKTNKLENLKVEDDNSKNDQKRDTLEEELVNLVYKAFKSFFWSPREKVAVDFDVKYGYNDVW